MARAQVVVGLDIGTAKVCTLIGEVKGSLVQVVGVGVAPSRGIRRGIVVDMEDAAAAIASSLRKAETFSGYKIVGAYVAVSGAHLECEPVHGQITLSRERAVSRQDLADVLGVARPEDVPEGRRTLHVLPKGYVVDGEDGINNPLGMLASTLEVEGLRVTAGSAPLLNLARCVERAGIKIDGFVSAGLASAYAALSESERQLGVLLVDIGGGTTDLVWIREDAVQYVGAVPFGGNHVTNDLSMVLGLPFAAAEELKVQFASAAPGSVPGDEMVDVGAYSDAEMQEIPRRLMAEVAEARLSELLSMGEDELRAGGFDRVLPAGVVLTGGSAQLRGMREMVQDVFGVPARIGQPEGLDGPVDSVVSPVYSTGVGLLKWVLAQPGDLASSRPARRNTSLAGRLKGMIRAFLP